MPSHPEVKAAVCAGVALWMTKAIVCDAYGLCALAREIKFNTDQIYKSIFFYFVRQLLVD